MCPSSGPLYEGLQVGINVSEVAVVLYIEQRSILFSLFLFRRKSTFKAEVEAHFSARWFLIVRYLVYEGQGIQHNIILPLLVLANVFYLNGAPWELLVDVQALLTIIFLLQFPEFLSLGRC
jgi:hypothetical protein